MVVGAFPVAKLGALLLKQISKPIANAVKQQAKSSPVFRTYVCMPPAQIYNWCEVKLKMWILNLGKPVNIPVLSEAMAIELGANLLGEGIIFIVAAGILIVEYNRSAAKEVAKEAAKQAEMDEINKRLGDLFYLAQHQSAQIREIMNMVSDLETRVVQKPWVLKKEHSPEKPVETASQPTAPFLIEPEETVSDDRSLESLQRDLLSQERTARQPGILTIALDHIYKNVYGNA